MVEMTTQRTDDGIVQARGTIDGKSVAFVAKRSTFNKEVDSALTYVEIMDPNKINGAEDFQRAFGRFGFTFNWFYIDPKDIAFQLGGYHPNRARHTDPDLPVWGDRRSGTGAGCFRSPRPRRTSVPKKGFITSWNNKQAPGFRANDGQYSFGPVHRVDPLDEGILAFKRRDRRSVWPISSTSWGTRRPWTCAGPRSFRTCSRRCGKPDDERLGAAYDLLKEWIDSGAHRRDKDADGVYDHAPAVALMDAWWEPSLEAIFKPVARERVRRDPVRRPRCTPGSGERVPERALRTRPEGPPDGPGRAGQGQVLAATAGPAS